MDDFLEILGAVAAFVGGLALVIFTMFVLPVLLFGDRRVEEIKLNADHVFKDNGFQIIGYQGYQYGLWQTPGGCVWYTLSKTNITYEACLSRWGNEYHIYNLKAIDAIKPN